MFSVDAKKYILQHNTIKLTPNKFYNDNFIKEYIVKLIITL